MEIPYTRESIKMVHNLCKGNPLWIEGEITSKGKSTIQGNPLYMEIPYTRKPLICGNSCNVKCLRKDNPKKPLVNGNPLYKEIPDKGRTNHTRGTPRKYKGGPLLYMETRVKWMPFQQRGASTSEPFRGIKCTFENTKSHREHWRNQDNQRWQGKHYQQPSRKPNKPNKTKLSDPCRPKWTWVWKFVFVCCWCPRWFW